MEIDHQSDSTLDSHLLARLAHPLLASGWSAIPLWEDETSELYLERSGFYITLSWSASLGQLVVDDGTEALEWEDPLPPLSPLDAPLVINLPANASAFRQAELTRQAFAAAGLLDATRLLISGPHDALRPDLAALIRCPIFDAIKSYRREDHAGPAMERMGKNFNWRIASGMRAWPIIVPAVVPSVAARGIAEWCWRRESAVEDWHNKVDDLTMARANISATRAVLPHVHQSGVDWAAVRLALTAADRHLADGRALSHLFEEGWGPILTSIHREVDLWELADDELGPEAVLRLLTLHGSRTESIGEWWGSGWYETAVRRALPRAMAENTLPASIREAHGDAEHLADLISHGPDLLNDDILLWATTAVHAETRYSRQEHPPAPFAVTLPTWAAEQLIDLLSQPDPSDDEDRHQL